MRKFTKLMLTLALLVVGVGGTNTVKADPIRLYASSFSGFGGNVSYSDGKLQWKGTSDNVATAITVEAGAVAKFSKIKFTCSGLTEGASYRVMITTSSGSNYISETSKTGDVTVNFSDLTKQWESEHPTSEVLATVTSVRIGGGTGGSPTADSPYELTINPTSFYIESEDEVLSIASTDDWTIFSKMVASGVSPLNAQLTADVDAGSTMVGAETSGKRYKGTFDGSGHTLTFNYNGSAEKVAPFQAVEDATIKNLKTTGSITSSGNLPAGIAGQIYGTTTIDNCSSDMSLSTTATSNGRIGGLVSRCKESGAVLTLSNCLFNGSLSTSTTGSGMICGLIGYSAEQTVNLSSCFVNPTSITGTGDQRFSHTRTSISNCWYTSVLNTGNGGDEATSAKLASGEVTYNLQGEQATQYWGQDLKAVSSSPLLTDNVAYKVFDLGGGEYANWTNTISNNADWVTFSKLVANGSTTLNVTMTADVNAGSTMVGTSSNPYTGTFDGAGHTLSFTYDGAGNKIAPFGFTNGATIVDLKTTGSITSSGNCLGGIIGDAYGANQLIRCASDMTMTSNDSENGRVGGLVGRCTEAENSITFTNCLYNGAISSAKADYACGFVGWSTRCTLIVSNCLVAPKSVTNGGKNFSDQDITIPAGKYAFYTTQFGSSTQGSSKPTDAQLYNGYVAYTLNSDISDGVLFFGQGKLNSSVVELPSMTSVASKKVYKAANENLYANADGLLPDPALSGKLAWKMAMTWDPIYFNVLPAANASSFNLYGSADSYILKVSKAGVTTMVVPFSTDALPSGVKAYDLAYKSGDKATATEVTKITANKPVLISAAEGEYRFESNIDPFATLDFSTYTETTNGALTGVYNTSMPFSYVPEDAYVLQDGADGLGFYKVDAANTIKITSFRAYLTAETPARSLSIVFADETTGISEVSVVKDKSYFNLGGQRVSKPAKGLYIMNGKKVMIK